MSQKMQYIGTKNRKSNLGNLSRVHIYQAQNCQGCPMRGSCHKSKGKRRIELNHRLLAFRKLAQEKLLSTKGLKHRSKRPIEPKSVFGQIKYHNKFNRFTLRGLPKVETGFGLVAISHSLRKIAKISRGNGFMPHDAMQERIFRIYFGYLLKKLFANS